MFGSEAKKKQVAAKAAFDLVSALCAPYTRRTKLSTIATTDPHLSGFLSSRIANTCALAAGEYGLDHESSKEIGLMVLQEIYGHDLTEVLAYAKSLNMSGNSEYRTGQEYGRKFLKYVTNREDIRKDPDFDRAMEIASSMGLPKSSDISIPLAGLDQIWFGARMERYL